MSHPMKVWQNWFALSAQAVRLGWEAQNVIALRLMRMAANGGKDPAEAQRMVTEKVAAGIEAHAAAATALVTGSDNLHATKRAMGVYKQRVRANKGRLGRSRKTRSN